MGILHDRTGFERDILIELGGLQEPNGRQLRDELAKSFNDPSLKKSRVYETLRRLADQGFVDDEAVDGRENVYRLSEEGREAVTEYAVWVRGRVPE